MLYIYFIYSSVHLLIPYFLFIPPSKSVVLSTLLKIGIHNYICSNRKKNVWIALPSSFNNSFIYHFAVLSCSVVSDFLPPYWLPGFSVHGDSPGKNTREGCHVLLQEIFPTQRSNPGLPNCRQILYCLSYQGSPFIQFTSPI